MNTKLGFRYYQQQANDAIHDELLVNGKSKCIVKMFCGTGKSILMRYCRIVQNKNLVVYVVPSLSLLEQFYEDYFIETKDFPLENILRVSSEEGSTTEVKDIVKFLKKKRNKIICVTYQSFETLVTALNGTKIDVCVFDEAHHAVGKTYQPLVFDSGVCEKQIFFTATPKKSMYSGDEFDVGMCGNIVYDYSYFRGAMEGYLNPFEIRIDFYTENINASVYESIARAVLASGNSRVLTFHAYVNGDGDTSVSRFVDERLFIDAFNKVLDSEFPEKAGFYTSLKMVALSASIGVRERKRILKQLDETLDNEVFVISSCQTIGEGVDTKKANMCVFVDPKSSFVAITQNIGRIVRKVFGQDKPNSTILIACWVDKDKYLSCDGDRDKCDEVIREDMNKDGNFNGILNVMSALKQGSEDLFDACLNYPSTYSPQEIEGNLSKHGYQLEDIVGDGYLVESLEYMLDTEIACDDDDETDEELLARTAEENNVTIEVHSDSLETPIEYYGQDDDASDKEVIGMFRSYDEGTEETVYQPITTKDGKKRNTDRVEPLRRENRFNVKVHTNPDVKVLWNLSSDLDFTKDICSCVIDCEVVDMWPQRLEELKAFIDENERTPSSISKNQEEKLLGRWLSNQTQTYNNNKMKTIRTNLWILFLEEYKEYVISNDEKWAQVLDELKAFINDNKRRPSVGSKDKEEKQLAQWTTDQQKLKNKNKMDANRTSLWTQILEEYKEYFLTDDELWLQKFEALKSFINDNKKKPSEDSKILSVKTLGRWSSNQNTNYKNNKMDSTRSPLWTQFLEEYKEYFLTDDEIWSRKLEELKEFINDKKIRPSQHTTDINENSIASWFGTQQRTYTNNKMDATRSPLWILFLEEHKEYFPTEDDKWFRQFEEVKTFMDAKKKRPAASSKNIEENSLGTWLTNQITNYKNKSQRMNDEKYYKLFQTFLKEHKKYFLTDDEIWFEILEEVKTFMDAKKKRPSSTDKNATIAKLGRWIVQQKSNYKDNNKGLGLSHQNNRTLWEQFSKEYLHENLISTAVTIEEEISIIVPPKPKQKKTAKLPKLTPKSEAKEETKVETTEDIRVRTKPLITQFHNKFCKMRSDNLAQHFKDVPSDFAEYHRVRDECFQTFEAEDIPCNRVISELEKIKTKRQKRVVDMGCGTAKISERFSKDTRFNFTNYDHVAVNEAVEVCDISLMPLEDDSVEICIMSLALWGSNCEEYVREAFRVLETSGILYIIDSTKRWSEEGSQDGGQLKQMLEANGFRIIVENADKWCYFECIKL
jgi:superfamily II DNA or RNA helicase